MLPRLAFNWENILRITRAHIRARHVTFSYIPNVPVLRDVSFQAEPGQTIALVGLTGAGKTTMINLPTRFYDIQEGKITIDGYDIRELQKNSLRRELAS